MSDIVRDADNYLIVFIIDGGGSYHFASEQKREISAAFCNWIEKGIDKLLDLTTDAGADVLLPASRIAECVHMTGAVRDAQRALNAERKAPDTFDGG